MSESNVKDVTIDLVDMANKLPVFSELRERKLIEISNDQVKAATLELQSAHEAGMMFVIFGMTAEQTHAMLALEAITLKSIFPLKQKTTLYNKELTLGEASEIINRIVGAFQNFTGRWKTLNDEKLSHVPRLQAAVAMIEEFKFISSSIEFDLDTQELHQGWDDMAKNLYRIKDNPIFKEAEAFIDLNSMVEGE